MMQTYIALLRGINVGGQKKVDMKGLKEALGLLGLKQVTTYIQSGNIVFNTDMPDRDFISKSIQGAIKDRFGFDVPTLTKSHAELKEAISKNPFANLLERDEKQLYVTFLSRIPEAENVAWANAADFFPEAFSINGDVVYLNCANGYGKTKLDNNFLERKLKTTATTRNWNTVKKLAAIADSLS